MKTTIQENGGSITAIFEGRLDTAAATITEQALKPLHEFTGSEIIFDCNELKYISSSGLRLLLGVLKSAKPKGQHVYIMGISDDIRTVFAITGFTNLFEFK